MKDCPHFFQRNVAFFFLSGPVDHLRGIYGDSSKKAESNSAGAQWSHGFN